VLVRMGDKLRRAVSITDSGVTLVDDEGLRDTLMDLHNYAAMGIMLLDEGDPDDKEISDEEWLDSIPDDEPLKAGWERFTKARNDYLMSMQKANLIESSRTTDDLMDD